jgi:hypothetical protein
MSFQIIFIYLFIFGFFFLLHPAQKGAEEMRRGGRGKEEEEKGGDTKSFFLAK